MPQRKSRKRGQRSLFPDADEGRTPVTLGHDLERERFEQRLALEQAPRVNVSDGSRRD